MPEEIGEAASPEGGVCGILRHRVEDEEFGYAFPPEPIWQLRFQGEASRSYRSGARRTLGGRKGVEEFSSEETGSVSFVG